MSALGAVLTSAHFRWRNRWTPPPSIRHHFDPQLAAARAVKIAQENSLPPAQDQAPAFDEQRFRVPNHRRLQVRIAIAIVVVIVAVTWRQRLQEIVEVLLQSRIVILVDQNRRRGVGDEEETYSALRPRLGHDLLHKVRDVLEFDPRVSFNISSVQPGKRPLRTEIALPASGDAINPRLVTHSWMSRTLRGALMCGVHAMESLRQGGRCGRIHRNRGHSLLDEFRRAPHIQPFKQECEFPLQVLSDPVSDVGSQAPKTFS